MQPYDYKSLFRNKVAIHFDSMYKYIAFSGLPKSVCDSVAQQTMEMAWKRIKQLKNPDEARAWLFGIAFEFIRKHSPWAEAENFCMEENPHGWNNSIEDLSSEVLEILEKAQSKVMVYQMLNQMDEECRRIIILYYYLGHSWGEICKIMNQTYDEIRAYHFKALDQMRSFYKEYGDVKDDKEE